MCSCELVLKGCVLHVPDPGTLLFVWWGCVCVCTASTYVRGAGICKGAVEVHLCRDALVGTMLDLNPDVISEGAWLRAHGQPGNLGHKEKLLCLHLENGHKLS